MRAIRASELGSYLYCRRAWWYRKQGVEPENQAEMDTGSSFHRQHGGRVIVSMGLRMVAWVLLLAAVVLLAVNATAAIFQ